MPTINFWTYRLSILEAFEGVRPMIASCNRHFPKSRVNATFQMVINGANPGLWSVFHIETLWWGNILARNPRFLV
jgi:hypothetical protein